jgi:hypothetical protein
MHCERFQIIHQLMSLVGIENVYRLDPNLDVLWQINSPIHQTARAFAYKISKFQVLLANISCDYLPCLAIWIRHQSIASALVGVHFFGGPRRAGFMDHPPRGNTDIFSQELHALCISKSRLEKKKIYSLVKFVCRKLSSGSSSATSRVYIFLYLQITTTRILIT